MPEVLRMTDPLETRASLIHRLPDSNDVTAWDEFVAIYAPVIYRLARRRNLQPADAEDLVQEVLTSVSRSIEAWLERTDRGRFRAWLFRIARNTTVNFLTRSRYYSAGAGGQNSNNVLDQIPATEIADTQFETEYRREIFRWAAIQVQEQVTAKTWTAFHRSSVEARPVSAVAAELNISPGRVYVARSRVMARLRALIETHEESDT